MTVTISFWPLWHSLAPFINNRVPHSSKNIPATQAGWLSTSPAWSWTSLAQSVTKTGFDRYIDVYDVYWCLSNLSIHMRWLNRFVYSWVLTRSRSVSLKRKFHCFCMFWPRNFTKFIHELVKFHIWNNRLFQMPFERVESASPQPNAWVFA